jgi:hypothetical protein
MTTPWRRLARTSPPPSRRLRASGRAGRSRTSGDRVLEHYTLHHLGRFLVDADRTDEAVACFEACLEIREEQGEPRAESTLAALAALAGAS